MSGADLNLIRNELREHDGTGIAAPQRGRIKRIFEKLYDRDGTAFSLKRPILRPEIKFLQRNQHAEMIDEDEQLT
jgi:hypothetical protein